MPEHPPQQPQPAPSIAWAGDRFLRIAFGDIPDAPTGNRIRAAFAALSAASIPGLLDLTPAYTTILATFDARRIDAETEAAVRTALAGAGTTAAPPSREVEVPVCYGGRHGEDLEDLARAHNLTADETISCHTSAIYTVAFIGFNPGFPYIRGLPDQLATPRLASPRPRVPAGSIGIAGTQTGIYPGGTPGGWRLIGRTPLSIFDPARDPAALLAAGDRVRFTPISAAEFDRIAAAQQKEGR